MRKILIWKCFSFLFRSFWVEPKECISQIFISSFIASVVDIGGKLLPTSLLLAIKYRWCHCYQRLIIFGFIDTVNKLMADIMGLMKIWGTTGIIAGINNIGNNLSLVTPTPVEMYCLCLSLVALTLALNTKLKISPCIFVKI
jgi:hypothetical protein